MAASMQDIRKWFEEGVRLGARYMLVICDTFDHADYPSYFVDRADAENKADDPGDMQRVMECYDLSADPEPQLSAHRAWAL